jgi:hypothetical protein
MAEEMKVNKETENGSARFFAVQGDIKVEIFYEEADPQGSLLKSIDQVDKLPAGYFTNLAAQNGLPCDPFDRMLLRPVIMGMIQIAWQRAFKGQPTEKLLNNQANRVEAYKRDLEHLKLTAQNPEQRQATARTPRAPKGDGTARVVSGQLRRLTEATAEKWSAYTGQKGVIVAAMMAAGAFGPSGPGVSASVLATACRGKFQTRQTEERIVGFYFAEWARQGVVEEPPKDLAAVTAVPEGWDSNVQTKESIAKIREEAAKPPATPAAGPKPAKSKAKKKGKKK